MSTTAVKLDSDAYLVCLTHTLSTEKEEIMGLLIGEMGVDRVCHIAAVIVLTRSDKQPDRVEISPEQLAAASTEAERLGGELGRPVRVVGWYHSHPHITVWPSHVDVGTQAMYQMLDEGFVGLIFSAFNQDKNTKVNKVQVTCFQSVNQSPEGGAPEYARIDIPLHIVPTPCIRRPNLTCLTRLPALLTQEETELYQKSRDSTGNDLITQIHNASVYSKSLCHILEILSGPLVQSLESRLEQNTREIARLEQEKLQLATQLKAQTDKQSTC